MSGVSSLEGDIRGARRWHVPELAPVKAARRALHAVFHAVGTATIAVGVAISCLAMFMPVNFLQTILPHTPVAITQITQPTAKTTGPHLIQNKASAPTCRTADLNSASDFSACPSFTLDFTKMANGGVSDKYLNISIGRAQANQEAQVYTANTQNLRIENGSLILEGRNNSQAGTGYTSGKVDTRGKEDFMYGKLVVRAKMPTGIGTWPAIWMLPSHSEYSRDNALSAGEIDIAEAVGHQPGLVYSVAHSQVYDNNGVDRTFFNTINLPDNNTTFHDYEMNWTPTSLSFKVDGSPYFTYTKTVGADARTWPYDQPFYLIMNLAIGGSWGGSDRKDFPADGIDSAAFPTSLQIQSVHYYTYTGVK